MSEQYFNVDIHLSQEVLKVIMSASQLKELVDIYNSHGKTVISWDTGDHSTVVLHSERIIYIQWQAVPQQPLEERDSLEEEGPDEW